MSNEINKINKLCRICEKEENYNQRSISCDLTLLPSNPSPRYNKVSHIVDRFQKSDSLSFDKNHLPTIEESEIINNRLKLINENEKIALERILTIKKYKIENKEIDHRYDKMICEANTTNVRNDREDRMTIIENNHKICIMDKKEYGEELKIIEIIETGKARLKILSEQHQGKLEILEAERKEKQYKAIPTISKAIGSVAQPIINVFKKIF